MKVGEGSTTSFLSESSSPLQLSPLHVATPSNAAKPQAPSGSRGGGATQETGNGEAQRGSREGVGR